MKKKVLAMALTAIFISIVGVGCGGGNSSSEAIVANSEVTTTVKSTSATTVEPKDKVAEFSSEGFKTKISKRFGIENGADIMESTLLKIKKLNLY